ncbi:MAG: YegP family protein [Burkholderiales bacterium]|nr:MAG: YegP family protein [Burkholderiales bacterium]
MAGKYVISRTSNGKYHFVLKASNGEVILSSQTYASLDSARNGVESVRRFGVDDARFERANSSRGEPFFRLKANNGQTIGSSEMYSSQSACDNGIDSVRRHAADAELEEQLGA